MKEPRFLYFGNAFGASARITRIDKHDNLNHIIPVQGAASLPCVGGVSEQQTGAFKYEIERPKKMQLFAIRASHVRAHSELPTRDGTHKTEVMSEVDGVTFMDRVHVDRLRAKLRSVHPPNEKQAFITPHHSEITGLFLGDHRVEVELDLKPFQEHPTKESLCEFYAKDADFRKANFWRFRADDEKETEIPEYNGYIHCSLVKHIRFVGDKPEDAEIKGYTIFWKPFGRIVLGELTIAKSYHALKMMRVMMGSNGAGTGTGGGTQVNGAMGS